MVHLLALLLAAAPLDAGRDLTRRFYAGDTAAVWERMTATMQGALGSAEKLAAFRAQVAAQLGEEQGVVDEKVEATQGMQVYSRIARFAKIATPVEVRWVLDGEGKVAGFFIKPAAAEGAPKEAPSSHLGDHTKTPLTLPFDGEWLVFWGGTTVAQNYHATTRDQRFAYDLLKVKDGRSHRGEGKALADYYAFGRPILAPGAGTVVAAVDGLPDQAVGSMDPAHAMGNHVVLDHGNGEFSFLCHLQRGSVKVKAGDQVKAGQRLGLCGNSGNTTEPHLHYHLQNSSRPFDGDGLPAEFRDYLANGTPVEHGIPTKGQVIRKE